MDKSLKKMITFASLLVLLSYIAIHFAYIYLYEPEPTVQYDDLAYVHYIDVGQGDSILIQTESFNMLIDAGENSAPVIEYLNSNKVTHLNYVVATHPHADHIGGMVDVISEFKIDNFIMPDVVHTSATFEKMLKALDDTEINIIAAEAGYKFGTDLVKFEVLGPLSKSYESLNNYSVPIRMVAGDTSFFFAGDAEKEVEKELQDAGYDLSSDVYKVSHHGSSSSSTESFIKAMEPKLAVISCGKDNTYGHPHRETVNVLNKYNVEVLRTDKNGTIIIYTDGVKLSYGSER